MRFTDVATLAAALLCCVIGCLGALVLTAHVLGWPR